jgi:uncharacterized protein (DUF1697 family)
MPRFVVLLRGVNVGTANRVPMSEFRALLAGLGFSAVRTLLNSGNAIFDAAEPSAQVHAGAIQTSLLARLEVSTPVVVKTAEEWSRIVQGNPIAPAEAEWTRFLVAFGNTTDDVRTLAPLTAMVQGQERIAITDEAAYLHCADGIKASKVGTAALGRAGRRVTTRNWATVVRVMSLVQGD